jgi:hypothetical protein
VTLSIEPIAVETRAARQARNNLAQNCASGLIAEPINLEWTFARDGALTARDQERRWITGCSLPRRAAMTQLRKLDVVGSIACFLAPAHASAIRVALDRMRPEQGVIAIVPDEVSYPFMLHCEDFSRDRAAHRIHFVVGNDWAAQLAALFDRIPGVAIPTQFIRVQHEGLDGMIADPQRVFGEATMNRAEYIQTLRTRPHTSSTKLCIVAPSQRRLWNDWGAILADTVCNEESECLRVDPDDPNQSSPLAVAKGAAECGAIVTVDVSRSDVGGEDSDDIPWVTWVTSGKVPIRSSCGPRDRLLVLDESDLTTAIRAGWSDAAMRIAKPPAGSTLFVDPRESSNEDPFIAIVADTLALEPPSNIDDFSSHRLLWEFVADELVRNPFAIGDAADAYLTSRMRKLDVSAQTLSRGKFIASLIVPAYQQGLLRVLTDSRIPVRAFGNHWNTIEDRAHFAHALAPSVALLHVFPDQKRVHAIDFAARPVIRPGYSAAEMIRRCREALRNPQPAAKSSSNFISASLIRELIGTK